MSDTDLRKNVVDEEGESWYVYDERRERLVYGPFGSEEYAESVMERASWPWPEDLEVGNESSSRCLPADSSQDDVGEVESVEGIQ